MVILPFNELKISETNPTSPQTIFENEYRNQIYTVLKIGTPEQSMMCIFNSENNLFLVGSQDDCYSKSEYNYSISQSTSSKIVRKVEGDDYFPGYSIINETIQLYTDINLKRLEEVPNFQIRYEEPRRSWSGKDPENKIFCGEIGFQINEGKNTWAKFVKQLKNADIINSYVLTLKYNSENSGNFYVGEYPHVYDPTNFQEEQLMTTYVVPKTSFSQFRILMDNIYLLTNNGTKFNLKNNEVYFHIELGLIEGPLEYISYINYSFFNKYYEKNICHSDKVYYDTNYYNVTICEDDGFNLKEFPSLFFYHNELNMTFELDYNDLFKKIDNKYLFLVSYSSFSYYYWKLGKPFLKKYQITLNLDAKTISFYNTIKENKNNNEEEKEEIVSEESNNIYLIILCFILSTALFIVTFYFTKELKNKRKKKANELTDDNFDYSVQDNKNEPNPYEVIKNDNSKSELVIN